MIQGEVIRVSGPVVHAGGLRGSKMYDVVRVGEEALTGEVIRLDQDVAVVQVYEDTTGLRTGEIVENTGEPLRVELGPGLLASIYDGVQRPLPLLAERSGDFISRGLTVPGIDHGKRWEFVPDVRAGAEVGPGDVLGTVREYHLDHRVLVPPGMGGTVENIEDGSLTIDDEVARLNGDRPIRMGQTWPVRKGRPYARKLDPTLPLMTGQRIFDSLFPIAKGGTAMIPGGFGTGKTVSEQTLARWADAHVVVYIGCGERGNEMTDVLSEFPELVDPRTGHPLLERTIMIANTSNMPVAAREASIYTGITMAEYYRDMGYDVALLADSTSRWGEALREVSGRLEEMPGEEGYPAYLAARLAAFYERAGRTACLGGGDRSGSVTVVGAVSPPGGDFSEPITQNTLRIVGTFWALDTNLAYRRHFPSVSSDQVPLPLPRQPRGLVRGHGRAGLEHAPRPDHVPPPEGGRAAGDRPARRARRPARGREGRPRGHADAPRGLPAAERVQPGRRLLPGGEAVPDAEGDPGLPRRRHRRDGPGRRPAPGPRPAPEERDRPDEGAVRRRADPAS